MWKSELIGDVFSSIKNGLSIKQKKERSGLPITRIETIWNWKIDSEKVGYADIVDHEKYDKYLLKPGDILMSHINSMKHLGKCAIYKGTPKSLIHGMNLLNLRADKKKLDPIFANYFFTSVYFKYQVEKIANQSVNQSSFSVTRLKTLKIPLPPLPIQRRIAAILDQADALRRKDAALLARYDALAQSIFLEMFGDPVRNESKEMVVELGDVCTKITDGVHHKPDYKPAGIPFISVKNITTGKLIFEGCKYVSEEDHEKFSRRCPVEFEDVLYTKVGATYGRPAIVNSKDEFSIYVSVALLKPDRTQINPYYLREAMANPAVKRQADRSIKGIGVPDLHLNMIRKFKIPLPKMEKQIEFEKIVKNIEQQKQLVMEQQKQSEDLFQSLLQKAFKGELVSEDVLVKE